MSNVLLDAQRGDRIVVVEAFACHNASAAFESPMSFTLGTVVIMEAVLAHPNWEQSPIYRMIRFRWGRHFYEAVHTSFVTLDHWERLNSYFEALWQTRQIDNAEKEAKKAREERRIIIED